MQATTVVSNIMNDIGLGSLDIGLIVMIIILLVLIFVLFSKTKKMEVRLKKFTLGKDGKSLEKDIIALYEDNKFLKNNLEHNKKDIRILYKNMESAFQKVGIVKYDAFKQMGGQLSFSLALLDENNNGLILNSVHSTEGCYTYTKKITAGVCEIDLGEEESQALAIAMSK